MIGAIAELGSDIGLQVEHSWGSLIQLQMFIKVYIGILLLLLHGGIIKQICEFSTWVKEASSYSSIGSLKVSSLDSVFNYNS